MSTIINLCRICLKNQSNGCKSIFAKFKEENFTTADFIMTFTNLKLLESDGYPHTICSDCFKIVENIFEAINYFEVSDNKMKNFFQKGVLTMGICQPDFCDLKIENIIHENQYTVDDIKKQQIYGDNHVLDAAINQRIPPLLMKDAGTSNEILVSESQNKKKKKLHIRDVYKISETGLYECFKCCTALGSEKKLRKHLEKHFDEPHNKCKHCNKTFSLKANLESHLRIHADRPYKCEGCFKIFKKHLRSEQKPYKCSYCDTIFVEKENFMVHLRLHNDESFLCEFCQRNKATMKI